MIKIRDEQFDRFERASREEFESELVAHCHEFVPLHVKAIGEDGTRTVVRLGIERAAGYGFTCRGPVRFYIELMFKFGSGFDTDLQLPWASTILKDRAVSDEMAKADRLHEAYLEYDAAVIGTDSEYARAASKRGAGIKLEELDIPPGQSPIAVMTAKMKEYYPQKAERVGDETLARLHQLGSRRAKQYGANSERSAMIFTVLMFAFGHQIDTDPLYPWVGTTLAGERIDDPNARVERAAIKTLTFGAKAVQYFERS